jgi:hypothetical protein
MHTSTDNRSHQHGGRDTRKIVKVQRTIIIATPCLTCNECCAWRAVGSSLAGSRFMAPSHSIKLPDKSSSAYRAITTVEKVGCLGESGEQQFDFQTSFFPTKSSSLLFLFLYPQGDRPCFANQTSAPQPAKASVSRSAFV